MNEYIEREKAKKATCEGCNAEFGEDACEPCDCSLMIAIDDIPAANVREVVHGKWIDEPIKGIRYHCSVCQGRFDYTWRYCPNCGADMRQEEKTE